MNQILTVAATFIATTLREAFNFEIEKLPLIAQRTTDGYFDYNSEEDDWPRYVEPKTENLETPHFGLFRNDNWECIGNSFKKNYVPHTTADVIRVTEAGAAAFNGDVSLRCHFHNAHYVHIRPTMEERTAIYGTEDSIFPVFGIRGGFDARGYQVWLGFGRDMCSNMAELKTVASCRTSIHHDANLSTNMDSLVETFANLKMNWDELVASVRRMEANEFDIDQFLEAVYPSPEDDDTVRVKNNHYRTIRDIKLRLSQEYFRTNRPIANIYYRKTSKGDNLIHGRCSGWLLFNAVQGYAQHDGRGSGTRTEFEGMIRASNSPRVAHAEKLALYGM